MAMIACANKLDCGMEYDDVFHEIKAGDLCDDCKAVYVKCKWCCNIFQRRFIDWDDDDGPCDDCQDD